MHRAKQFLMLFIILTLVCGNAHSALYSIANPRFSGFVDRDNHYEALNPAKNGKISRKVLHNGLLYFSVTILGNVTTFEYLTQHRHLELEVVIWADGEQKDSVPIGMTPRDWDDERQRLKYELKNLGFFTWRTYMNTVKIWHSKIELVLRDDNKEFVKPVGHRGSYRAVVEIVP